MSKQKQEYKAVRPKKKQEHTIVKSAKQDINNPPVRR